MIGAIASQYVGPNLAEILEIRNGNGRTEGQTNHLELDLTCARRDKTRDGIDLIG